jgi:hypothetical protein
MTLQQRLKSYAVRPVAGIAWVVGRPPDNILRVLQERDLAKQAVIGPQRATAWLR